MRARRLISAFSIVALLGGGSAAVRFAQADSPASSFTIIADVEKAPNLFVGGRVMVRGVEVGEISKVTPRADGVRLTIEIDEGIRVPADAQLSVIPITIIADRYVQLVPAYSSGPLMRDGDHITMDRTSVPAELDEVLTQLRDLVDAFGRKPGQKLSPLARLVNAADSALAGRARTLASTLDSSASVLSNLAASQSDIQELVRNLDQVFLALANRSSEIGLVNERFALVTEALAGDQEHLEGTIENLAFLSREAADLVIESGDRLGESFGRLETVLDTVLANEASLTKGARWTNAVAQALGEVDGRGRGKWAYTGRRAAPGTPGAAYNYRIDQRDTIGCGRISVISEAFIILNPAATVEQAAATILNFVDDRYDDDLTFLIEALIPFCSLIGQDGLDAQARRIVRDVAADIGEERFMLLLGRWFFEGYAAEGTP